MGLNRFFLIALFIPAMAVSCIKSIDDNVDKSIDASTGEYPTQSSKVILLNVSPADFVSSKSSFIANQDETEFRTEWVNGDKILVNYTFNGEPGSAVAVKTDAGFEAELPDERGDWTYTLVYGDFDDDTGLLDFNNFRTEFSYGEVYDVMASDLISVENALPGKDENGENLDFHLKRLTSTLLFHLSSEISAEVQSVSLEIEGDFPIGSKTLSIGQIEGESILQISEMDKYNSITLAAPDGTSAEDFTVAFNLLPVSFNSLHLIVELDNGTILGLKRLVGGRYEQGEMYYVRKMLSVEESNEYHLAMKCGDFTTRNFFDGTVGNEWYDFGGYLDVEDTKSSIGDVYGEIVTIEFAAGDLFDVFNGSVKEQFVANSKGHNIGITGRIKPADSFHVLYPSDSDSRMSSNRIHTSIPSEQTLDERGVDPKALLCACICPATSYISNQMYQLCAMLRFTTDFQWKKLIISTGEDNPLAGDIIIRFVDSVPYAEPDNNPASTITVHNPYYYATGRTYSVCLMPMLYTTGLNLTFFDEDDRQIATRTVGATGVQFNAAEALVIGEITQ